MGSRAEKNALFEVLALWLVRRDDELFRLCRQHVDADHPEMQRTDEQLRERIAADAYEAVTV